MDYAVEERSRVTAVGRDHPIARVEVTPLQAHRLAVSPNGKRRRGRFNDDVWVVAAHRRDRAAEADRLRSRVAVRLRVRVERHVVQKVEGDHVDAANGPRDEVLAGLLDPPGEELERIAQRGRPGIGRVGPRKSKPERVRDSLDLVSSRKLAAETVEVKRREDRGDGAADQREHEKDERHERIVYLVL